MIQNTRELNVAVREQAKAVRLSCDCMADGSLLAHTAVICEAPGEREKEIGVPLVGGAGKILWDVLRKHNIHKRELYVTNVIKRQVAFSDKARAAVGKAELQQWIGLLMWELYHLPNLKNIIVLGNFALEALTGHGKVQSWRGSVIDHTLEFLVGERVERRKVKLIVSFNPAMVARQPRTEIMFRLDMGKVKRVLDGTFVPHNIEPMINPTPRVALDWIRKMRSDAKHKQLPVSLDIESAGGETSCVGLANDAHIGMCINFRDASTNRWELDEEIRVRLALQEMLKDEHVRIIAQNGAFDATWMWYKDRIWMKIWFDTMLAHHALYPTLPHDLGFICAQYTTHPYYKDEKDAYKEGGDINTHWRYNVKDVCITYAAAMRLKAELAEQGMSDFFFNHVMRLHPHLTEMTVLGDLVDRSLQEQLEHDIGNDVNKLRYKVKMAAIEALKEMGIERDPDEYDLNPNSNPQLAHLFYSELRLNGGKGGSVNKESRDSIYENAYTSETARALIRSIDEYAMQHKFYSTYVKAGIDEDGRIRCTWNQSGVKSAPGRLSSSQTLWGSGMNLQNQPDRALEMYVADESCVYLYFDLSQAEARVVGWLANIQQWIEDFERARIDGVYDCHRALAAQMYGVPYDEVPTFDRYDTTKGHPPPDGVAEFTPTIRFYAKRARHGLNYRMGPATFSITAGLPMREAERIYNLYHRINPELQVWWKDLEAVIKRDRALFNLYNRRLKILERMDKDTLKSIVAFVPQSTIGDKVSEVIYLSQEDPRWPRGRARVIRNVHDALIGLAREDCAMDALRIMVEHAEKPLFVGGKKLIIPAEAGISVPDEYGVHRMSNIKKLKREELGLA